MEPDEDVQGTEVTDDGFIVCPDHRERIARREARREFVRAYHHQHRNCFRSAEELAEGAAEAWRISHPNETCYGLTRVFVEPAFESWAERQEWLSRQARQDWLDRQFDVGAL